MKRNDLPVKVQVVNKNHSHYLAIFETERTQRGFKVIRAFPSLILKEEDVITIK